MNHIDCLQLLLEKTGLSKNALSKAIGFKSAGHLSQIMLGTRKPTIESCFKIINYAKQYDVFVTPDMFCKKEETQQSPTPDNVGDGLDAA